MEEEKSTTIAVVVINAMQPELGLECEMDARLCIKDLKSKYSEIHPKKPKPEEQKIIHRGRILTDEATLTSIYQSLEGVEKLFFHVILPPSLNVVRSSPVEENIRSSSNVQDQHVPARSVPEFAAPSMIANPLTSLPGNVTESLSDLSREVEQIRNSLGSNNFSAASVMHPEEIKREVENVTEPAIPINNPSIRSTAYGREEMMRAAIEEYEKAHANLMNTIVLSQKLQGISNRMAFSAQPFTSSEPQNRSQYNMQTQSAGNRPRVRVTLTVPRGRDSEASGANRQGRRVVVNLHRANNRRPNQDGRREAQRENAEAMLNAGQAEMNNIRGNIFRDNENNVNPAPERAAQPNNLNRALNGVRVLNFSLLMRILFFIYIFAGEDINFESPTFLYTAAMAVGYYLYEMGIFDRLVGTELSITALLNRVSGSRFARIAAPAQDALPDHGLLVKRIAEDIFMFFKAFLLSLIPTWTVVEDTREEPPVAQAPEPAAAQAQEPPVEVN